jgi:hypothetical protein
MHIDFSVERAVIQSAPAILSAYSACGESFSGHLGDLKAEKRGFFLIQICRISRPIYSGIRKYRSRSLAWTLHVIFPPPQPNSQIITSALYIPSGSNKSLQVSSEPYD